MLVNAYVGKLEGEDFCALEPFVVRFADRQYVEFATEQEAHSFLRVYHATPSSSKKNPGKVYALKEGEWRVQRSLVN